MPQVTLVCVGFSVGSNFQVTSLLELPIGVLKVIDCAISLLGITFCEVMLPLPTSSTSLVQE